MIHENNIRACIWYNKEYTHTMYQYSLDLTSFPIEYEGLKIHPSEKNCGLQLLSTLLQDEDALSAQRLLSRVFKVLSVSSSFISLQNNPGG